MKNLATSEIWYVTGSQHLYGEETLRQVASHSQEIVQELNNSKKMALPLIFKAVVTTPKEIRRICQEASSEPNCAGLILWMHTFSPSKMWIGGLRALRKPFLHLHTQFNRDLPWGEIDMDFMNLNQAAHGDREAGFIHSGCGSIARSLSAIGQIRRCRTASVRGCAWSGHGTTGRERSSRALLITCGMLPSPKVTK